MDDLKVQIFQKLMETAYIILGLVGTYLVSKQANIFKLVDAKIDTISNEKLRVTVKEAFDHLDRVLETNISDAENTLKPAIIKAMADGKVTKDELLGLTDIVKTQVLKQLAPEITAALTTYLGEGLNDYIQARLVKVLHDMKDAEGTNVTHSNVSSIPVSYDKSCSNLEKFVSEDLPKQIEEDKKNGIFSEAFANIDAKKAIIDTKDVKGDGTGDVVITGELPS